MRRALPAALALALITHATGAFAVVPRPSARAVLNPTGDAVEVALEVENSGGTPMQRVFPVLRIGDRQVELALEAELAIGSVARWVHLVPGKELRSAGAALRPVLIHVHYHDSTGYPFSLPLVAQADGRPAVPVRGSLEVQDSDDRPRIQLTLKNPGRRELEGTAEFLTSRELVTEPGKVEFRLAAGQETRIPAQIRSNGALAGEHDVFAVVQLGEAAGEGTLVLSDKLKVTPALLQGESVGNQVTGIAILVALLFLVTALLELRSDGSPLPGRSSLPDTARNA